MTAKLDLKKKLKHLYSPSKKEVVLVDVPPMNFLMIDGKGDPNTSESYRQALEALYGVAYTLKFDLKKRGVGPDFTVMPLEGLWWMEGREDFDPEDKDNWSWTSMILQPDHITAEHLTTAMDQLREKKDPPALEQMRFEMHDEGLSAQIMHIGPYAEERTNHREASPIRRGTGSQLHKKHHEIYLGDPRRTKPENLRTVIRHPVREA